MNGSESTPRSGMRVVSTTPGRSRVRALTRSARAELASVTEAIATWPETASVELREGSASVVVRFDPRHAAAIADGLARLGVEVPPPSRLDARSADPAAAIGAAAGVANRAVAQRLDGTDLRVLVPVGLGLLAARRAMAGEDRLADAPWYLLAWYAFETFSKFNGSGVSPAPQLTTAEEA